MNSKAHGFTLIELLVVISIIALLSSVVLSSLQSARNKGNDTAVKAGLKQVAYEIQNIVVTGHAFGSGQGGATDVTTCTSGVFSSPRLDEMKANILTNAAGGATLTCNTGNGGRLWAMSVSGLRNSGTAWCIDSSSNFKAATAASGLCP